MAVGPFTQEAVQSRKEQERGEQQTDAITDEQPSKSVPGDFHHVRWGFEIHPPSRN
jgi:hypothetical protein